MKAFRVSIQGFIILGFVVCGSVHAQGLFQAYIVTATALHIRKEPSRTAESVGSVKYDDVVVVTDDTGPEETIDGTKGRWVSVMVGYDNSGYAFNGYLKKAQTVSEMQQAPRPKSLTSQCTSVDYVSCVVAIQQKLAAERPRLVKYNQQGLTLLLENGKQKRFERREGPGTDITFPQVSNLYESIGWVHVTVSYYEGSSDHLVNLRDGTEIRMIAPPVLSPDRMRFLAASSAVAYSIPGLQVVNVAGGRPVTEFQTSQSGDSLLRWLYSAEWAGSNIIRVRRYHPVPRNFQRYVEEVQTMRFANGKWVIQ